MLHITGKLVVVFLFILVMMGAGPAIAASPEGASSTLVVGTKETPPFAIKGSDGNWSGISIDLWRQVANELEVKYIFQERDLSGLLAGLEDGSLDASVAALTITAQREERMDFSHSFYSSGLGIALRTDDKGGMIKAAERFFSMEFFQIVGSLVMILLLFGVLVWFFEHKKNSSQFGGSFLRGIGAGFWWSAVTMTTVGYGDKAPLTLGGRLVAMVWMFAAIIIISSFTAAITSVLTLSGLETRISGPEDLGDVKVATVPASTSAAYLDLNRIAYIPYPSVMKAMEALSDGEVDAVVYDNPVLRYLVGKAGNRTFSVLPRVFDRQDYGIGLPSGSVLREPVNRIMLQRISSPWWDETLYRYLGAPK